MNEKEYTVYQALQRTHVFGATHAASFPEGSRAVSGFTRVGELLEEMGHVDLNLGVPASSATSAKAGCIDGLWDDLRAIARTARAIARHEPGFDTRFRLGGDSQRDILATAEIFAERLQQPGTIAKFTAYDLPTDIITSLQADLATIHAKAGEQVTDVMSATSSTARVRALVQEARDLLKTLDASVRNRFRDDEDILAAWRTAARVHRRQVPAPQPVTPAATA